MALKEILAAVAIGSLLSAGFGAYIIYPTIYIGQPYAYLGQQLILQWVVIGFVALIALCGAITLDQRSYSSI